MADWISLGTPVMREARKKQGLSYESAARLTHVSSKTYERREKAGRWPVHEIDQLADALQLDIERPQKSSVTLKADEDPGELPRLREELEVEIERLRSLNDALEAELRPGRRERKRRAD